MMMIANEKNMPRPTCWQARTTVGKLFLLSASVPSERWRYPFSIMTMEASTSTPMDKAIPPKDMIFEVILERYIGINETTTAMGRAKMGTKADRKWRRKMTITRLTTMIS